MALACVVAYDPASGAIKDPSTTGWKPLPLCSLPWSANYYAGDAKSMMWSSTRGMLGEPCDENQSPYGRNWVTRTLLHGVGALC